MKLANNYKTRVLYNYDFDRVVEIDCNNSGKYAWTPDELFTTLKSVHGMGIVAIDETQYPLGFCIYSLKNVEYFEILHIAVDKKREGVGTKLINKIKRKINEQRNHITFDVPETNLETQLFLKAMGFKAKLVRNSMEDIIRFNYEK